MDGRRSQSINLSSALNYTVLSAFLFTFELRITLESGDDGLSRYVSAEK
jgi:hypothetical protein